MKIKNKPILAVIVAIAILTSLSVFSTASADTDWWTLTSGQTYSHSSLLAGTSIDAEAYSIYITPASARTVRTKLRRYISPGNYDTRAYRDYAPGTSGANFWTSYSSDCVWFGTYDPWGVGTSGCGATGYVSTD